MRHALIDEALADIVMNRRLGWHRLSERGFLGTALAAVGEQIPGVAGSHQPCAGERQRDATRIHRDPASAPLLGDIGGGAGAAGGIEHEVAGISRH